MATATKSAKKAASPAKAGKQNLPARQNAELPVPAELQDQFLADAGMGLENARAEDFALPFVYLLQSLSPAVNKRNEAYIEGAEPGLFLNTVTRQVYGESINVIPVEFEKVYNEWIPRDEGGGFVASHRSRQEAAQNQQEDTQIVDTANHYVLIEEEDGSWSPAILSLTSTKLKASRNWLSRISQRLINGPNGRVPAPSFSGIYQVTAKFEKNNKGEYYNVQIEPLPGEDGWVKDPEVYQQARAFRDSLQAGRRGVDYSKMDIETVVEVEDEEEELAGKKPKF